MLDFDEGTPYQDILHVLKPLGSEPQKNIERVLLGGRGGGMRRVNFEYSAHAASEVFDDRELFISPQINYLNLTRCWGYLSQSVSHLKLLP